jgi:hypothetical protein
MPRNAVVERGVLVGELGQRRQIVGRRPAGLVSKYIQREVTDHSAIEACGPRVTSARR